MTGRSDLDHLISRGQALAATGRRRLLGICGAPGAGKSTLAERLVTALEHRSVRNVDHLDHLRGYDRRGSTWPCSA
jgi:pantothenate kinase-related protein Tda10